VERIPEANRIIDAACCSQTGHDGGSINDQLGTYGVKFSPSAKDRKGGWQKLISLMDAAGDVGSAGLYWTPRMKSWTATVPGLVYSEHDPEDLDTTGVDHTADAVRYLVQGITKPVRTMSRGGRIY
jgi:hypothetical protein